MKDPVHPETRCNHPHFTALPPDNRPLTPPLYQSVKFTIDDFSQLKAIFRGERAGFFYSRHGNPTTSVLENLLAQLQGVEEGRVTSTGIAAVSAALLGLLEAGDGLLYFIESYKPSRLLAETMLKKFGVVPFRLSLHDHEGIKAAFATGTIKAVLFESMTNPQLKAAPLNLIYDLAVQHQSVTVLDNTFSGFQSWRAWPFDLYIHSLTKYASGHGDVMGGAILGKRSLLRKLDETLSLLGATLDPHAAFLIQRGLKTYHLRRREQCRLAAELAIWLEQHPKVDQVLYPGLPSHPDHAWFREHFADYGTMIFFSLKNKDQDLERLVTEGQVFQLAASLGSTESLITPALFFFAGDLTLAERQRVGIDESCIRLSIGIEHIDDLKADLDQILVRT